MSFAGRLLRAALPLIKLRTQLRGVSLGVRVAVFDPAGRLLLVRHSYLAGWALPGGGVEVGETAAQAAQRELAEETGVALLEPPRLLGLYHNPEWTGGDHVAFFEAGAWTQQAWRASLEIEAAAFFAPAALPADTHASVLRRLAERAGRPVSTHW